jgi:hypothetical protein
MAKETPIQTVLEIVASKKGEELILDEAPFERRYLAEGASPRAVGETLHIQDETQGKVRGVVYFVGEPRIVGKGSDARRLTSVTIDPTRRS